MEILGGHFSVYENKVWLKLINQIMLWMHILTSARYLVFFQALNDVQSVTIVVSVPLDLTLVHYCVSLSSMSPSSPMAL